jgi:O-antigen/teichoic acid export membrane protein
MDMKIFFGINSAVLITLCSRGINVVAGLITLSFITHSLSGEMQGYYYTFNSLIALQIFVELGLTVALTQFSSHEMAGLSWQSDGTLSGQAKPKRRLQSILKFALFWFGIAAVVMIILLCTFGIYFFSTSATNSSASLNPIYDINIPWVMLVLVAAINIFCSAAIAVLEGCGQVTSIAKMRVLQGLIAPAVACLILYLGGGLYSLVGASMATMLVSLIWLWVNYRVFFNDLLTNHIDESGMNWRNEIWPFQWRIAVSWISGYLGFQLYIPLLFDTQGPVAAGQMGMTLQLINALNGVAIVWISTRAPIFGSLIANNQRQKLDELFFRSFFQSLFVLLMGLIILMCIIIYFTSSEVKYIDRVVPYKYFLIFSLISTFNHIVQSEAIYLRAHKEEPFLGISIVGGLMTLILSLILIPPFGLLGATVTYFTCSLIFGLVGGTLVFFYKRKEWSLKSQNQ